MIDRVMTEHECRGAEGGGPGRPGCQDGLTQSADRIDGA